MRIELSNSTFVEVPGEDKKVEASITKWFADALPDDVLVLRAEQAGKAFHIQKRHIVQIQADL